MLAAMWTVLVLIAGIFIGWTFPQPEWAKAFVAWVKSMFAKFKNLFAKKEGPFG